MKLHRLIAALAVAFSAGAYAAGEKHQHAQDLHEPLHGGVFVAGKAMDYELLVKPTAVQLWLRDHGKPLDVSKASAKLTLLVGSEKREVELQPAGDRLEATGSFQAPPGTKAVAVVRVPGKPVSTARFALE